MKLILLILFLLNLFVLIKSSGEYFLDTCCSFNKSEKINLSCHINEIIHLNLIEIYYNSNKYCSSELNCCKYQTKCSRRITKYSSLHCDGQNSCWIDKTCLKISKSCSNIYGLYGQYITINYTCLTNNSFNNQPVPFLLQFLTKQNTTKKSFLEKNFLFFEYFKSSTFFFIFILISFIIFMLTTYQLAKQIGKNICQKQFLKKTNLISKQIIYQHENNEKISVQSSLPITRIYPSKPIYHYIQTYYPSKQFINVQHNPYTGQISSRIFNTYSNYY